MKIFKYTLKLADIQEVAMPVGAKILTVQLQNNNICVWALVNEDEIDENRTFIIYGTGKEVNNRIEDGYEFLGSIQQQMFVWHIFIYKG